MLKFSRFYANVDFTMREFDMTLDWERKLLIAFTLLTLGTLLGPFGTYNVMGFWDRLTFWALDILGAAVLMHVIVGTFYNITALRFIPPVLRLFIGVTIAAIPTTAFIRFVFLTLMGRESSGIEFPLLWLEVTLISAAVLWTEYDLIPRLRRARGTTERKANPLFSRTKSAAPHANPDTTADVETDAEPAPEYAPLLDRLPDEARPGRLISISMQDHYAAVTMTTGTFLLLMRLSDALQLLGQIKGAQVHRSHWAAADFASDLTRDGRRTLLQLRDGRTLPVSASYLDAAKTLVG